MLDGIRHNLKLNRLQRNKRDIENHHDLRRKQAREQKKDEGGEEMEAIEADERMDLEEVDDEIARLLSARLREQADKYFLPEPPFTSESGDWIQSRITGGWHLSRKAIADLRAAIRKEQKERVELFLTLTASLTGIIGAVIGLVSLLKE